MKKLTMTVGLPASGKTTWAKKMMEDYPGQIKRVNKDELRLMIDAGRWTKSNESFILKIRDKLILEFMEGGFNIIVDDTNFAPKHKDKFLELVKFHNSSCKHHKDFVVYEFEVKDFTDVSLEECLIRDGKRSKSVGETVIKGMYRKYLYKELLPPPYLDGLPSAYICDIDGTIAKKCDRSPYDEIKVYDDDVNLHVKHVINALMSFGYKIIFISGRTEGCREQTIKWLNEKAFIYEGYILFMREVGDFRSDYIVKNELYEKYIKGQYNVFGVFDDRPQVIEKCWRPLGIPIFNCGDGTDF
jgi:predicted kinase